MRAIASACPGKLFYEEVFNTDDAAWGGSGVCNTGPIPVEDIPSHGRDTSISLRVPPLGAVFLQGRVRRRSNQGSNRQTGGNEQT